MLSDELFRVAIEEREREVESELRARRLLGPARPVIRWHRRPDAPFSPAASRRPAESRH